MLDFITDLALKKKLEFQDGEILLFRSHLFLIPPDVYVVLLKELRKEKKHFSLYSASKKSSFSWMAEISKETKRKSSQELIKLIPKILNILGLGKVSAPKKISKYEFDFYLEESLTAELYGPSKEPVDLQFAGLLAGFFSFIFKKNFSCEEIECMSQGFEKCKFRVKLENV